MVIGQGMTLAGMGLGIRLAVAFAITRLMASLLFGVSASDPPTFLGVIVILRGQRAARAAEASSPSRHAGRPDGGAAAGVAHETSR